MKNFFTNFFKGFGNIFNIGGDTTMSDKYRNISNIDYEGSLKSDYDAIKSDCDTVGKDFDIFLPKRKKRK